MKKQKIIKFITYNKRTKLNTHLNCFLTISTVLPREIYSLTIPFHFFPKPWREVPFSSPISFTPDSVRVQHTSKFEEVDESILYQLCFNEALQFSKPSHKKLKRKRNLSTEKEMTLNTNWSPQGGLGEGEPRSHSDYTKHTIWF